jgi:hypothetical protein
MRASFLRRSTWRETSVLYRLPKSVSSQMFELLSTLSAREPVNVQRLRILIRFSGDFSSGKLDDSFYRIKQGPIPVLF